MAKSGIVLFGILTLLGIGLISLGSSMIPSNNDYSVEASYGIPFVGGLYGSFKTCCGGFLIFFLGGVIFSSSLAAGTGAVALEITKEKDNKTDLIDTDKSQSEEPVPQEIQLAGLSIAWRQLRGDEDGQSRLYHEAEIYNDLRQNKEGPRVQD